jgi:hypothetical protein
MTTPDTTARAPRIDPAWTVNEVVRRHPATVAVFNAFGFDACCGGAHPVREAAGPHGADLGALVAALEAVAGGWGGAPLPLTTIAPRRGVR